jgi:type I restriction enzyme S subunit
MEVKRHTIPDRWISAPLGQVCGRITTGKLDANAMVADGEYPFFTCAKESYRINSYAFDCEALLVSGNGANVGYVHYYKGKFNAYQRTYVLSDFSANVHFLKLFLDRNLRDRIRVEVNASNTPYITRGTLTEMGVVLPANPDEQLAIAEALSDIGMLLGGLDRLITKKRDLKQAAMQQLLTGQIRLSGFDGDWEVKTLGELFNFSGGYSASRAQLSSEGHCYLHYGDIHGATKTFVDVGADYQDIPKLDIPLRRVGSKSLLEDGDVVFVDASEDDEGASRHVVVVNKDKKPFISGLHTIVAKSKTDELAHEYRRYCFQTKAIRDQFLFYSVGTKVTGISKTNIAKLTMPVPKVSEQTAITEVLTDMDAELAALEQRRQKTRDLKQTMMQELLTGKRRLV